MHVVRNHSEWQCTKWCCNYVDRCAFNLRCRCAHQGTWQSSSRLCREMPHPLGRHVSVIPADGMVLYGRLRHARPYFALLRIAIPAKYNCSCMRVLNVSLVTNVVQETICTQAIQRAKHLNQQRKLEDVQHSILNEVCYIKLHV